MISEYFYYHYVYESHTIDIVSVVLLKQMFITSCPPHWGVDISFLLFPVSSICCPSCLVSFQGKVFILCLPNLVWVFIGLIVCMGLLLSSQKFI